MTPIEKGRWLHEIIIRGTGLDESGRINVDRLTKRQRARWLDVVADNEISIFRKRLVWEGDPSRAPHIKPTRKLRPPWADVLVEICATAKQISQEKKSPHKARRRPRYLVGRDRCAFAEIYAPFILVARRRLEKNSPSRWADVLVSSTAFADLEHGLLRQLAFVGYASLATEATSFSNSKTFADVLFADGFTDFFRRYSVLARLTATLCAHWVANTAELIERLHTDAARLAEIFFEGHAIERLDRVEPMLGDSHRSGRTVAALVFQSGARIVYKPRALKLESAFHAFAKWCNDHSGLHALHAPRVLDRGDYGWVEFVSPRPCRATREVVRYHERAGMLLATFYLLGESDCHSENLVAAGEHPLPLDLETMLRPEEKAPSSSQISGLDPNVELLHDVAGTALLPIWGPSTVGGGPYAEGGLAGGAGQRTLRTRPPKGRGIIPRVDFVRRGAPPNWPMRRNDMRVASEAHVEDIVRGFRAMYRFFFSHRRALLSSKGPLLPFAQPLDTRFVLRPTRVYALLQEHSFDPRFMRDGMDRAITLDALARPMLGDENEHKPKIWPTLASEMAALERLDVPIFSASPLDRHLRLDNGGGIVKDVFAESGLEATRRRVRDLGTNDLERQTYLIRAHFACFAPDRSPVLKTPKQKESASLRRTPKASSTRLIEKAIELGVLLEQSALPARDGAVTWLAPEMSTELRRYRLRQLGLDYGGGAAGIALFLAALDRVTGRRRRFSVLAERALLPLRRKVTAVTEIGGMSGLGAAIYCLTRSADLLSDTSLYDDARRLCDLVGPDHIRANNKLDVIHGTAGMLLAVLALYRATNNGRVLALARALGKHLLRKRQRSDVAGLRAWPTHAKGRMGGGFFHGQSGIALALARLGRALGGDGGEDPESRAFVAAAEEAFAFERTLYPRRKGGLWIDRFASTGEKKESIPGSFCRGPAGFLLARLDSLPAIDTPAIRNDCEAALDACLRVGIVDLDHICCGNFGRLEVEWLAADILNQPHLREQSRRKATALLDRASRRGGYSLLSPSRQIAHPSLYFGIAGIGYTLLRLAAPDLPSILLVE